MYSIKNDMNVSQCDNNSNRLITTATVMARVLTVKGAVDLTGLCCLSLYPYLYVSSKQSQSFLSLSNSHDIIISGLALCVWV